MVSGGVVLGEVVSKVVSAATPVDEELSLLDPVSYPIKAHVNGFRTALLDCVVGDPSGASIVCLDRSGLLRMAHAVKSGSEHGAIFGIVEKRTKLGLCGRG